MVDFAAVRALAVALPGVDEGTWYGSAAFRVAGKVFARRHENDDDLFLMKVGRDERDALIADRPDRFIGTDHRPEREDSVLMRLSATEASDLVEVGELVTEAWRRIAPADAVEAFDAS